MAEIPNEVLWTLGFGLVAGAATWIIWVSKSILGLQAYKDMAKGFDGTMKLAKAKQSRQQQDQERRKRRNK